MKLTYSAVIRFDTSKVVAVEFARPVSPETTAELKKLESYEGIKVLPISEEFGKRGYYVTLSSAWDKITVARECLKILLSEDFGLTDIRLDGFMPD